MPEFPQPGGLPGCKRENDKTLLLLSTISALVWLVAFLLAKYAYHKEWIRRPLQRDVNAIGALGLATCGFFWPVLFTGDTWIPAGGGDLVAFLYPIYSFASHSLKQGRFALWNPHLYGGAPFLADIQSGLLYPINLAFFLFVPRFTYRTIQLMAILHIFLAGVSMYLCLRFLEMPNIRRLAALAGAIAFMFSDLFITHLGNLNMIAAAAWLPLVFLCYHRSLDDRNWWWALAAGIFLGVASLAGHVQMFLYMVLLLLLYLAFRAHNAWREDARATLKLVGLSLVTLALAFGLAAPVLLPALQLSRLSIRARLSYQEAAAYSLFPEQLVGMLVPDLFGRGPGGYWGPWRRVEVGYIGIFPLMLALITVIFRRDRLTRFLMGLAILSLLLSLGGNAILHGWLYLVFPGFRMLRVPARFIILLDFALVALAARGLNMLLEPLRTTRRDILWRVMVVLALGLAKLALIALPLGYALILASQAKPAQELSHITQAMGGVAFFLLLAGLGVGLFCARRYRWMRRETIGALAAAIIFFDLASLGAYTELERRNPTANYHHPKVVEFLRQDPSYFRIDARTGCEDVWQPSTSLLHGFFDVGGVYNPLLLADFERYWSQLGSRSTPLYDLLNVKYIIGHKDVPLDWDKFVLAFDGDPQVNVYRNTKVQPRAFLVQRVERVESREAALVAIHRPDFDPRSAAVVERGPPLYGEPDTASRAGISRYEINLIELETSSRAESLLFLSEVFYPGWKVVVDGKEQELLRANYLFRAVRLEPGEHRVVFLFDPPLWKAGLGVCVFTFLALTISLSLATFFSKRRPQSTGSPGYLEWR